jgi:predicted RNA-binding Zn-ribbon protein involved in translation (DUF1610 family)
MNQETLICFSCETPLEKRKGAFKYMGFDFYHELPACPKCGQGYISEELTKGRMAEVEMNLEDK